MKFKTVVIMLTQVLIGIFISRSILESRWFTGDWQLLIKQMIVDTCSLVNINERKNAHDYINQ